jgi:hypothetical protein
LKKVPAVQKKAVGKRFASAQSGMAEVDHAAASNVEHIQLMANALAQMAVSLASIR